MTANGDLPAEGTAVETTPATYDQQVKGISDLLEDPDTPDLQESDEDTEAVADDPAGEDGAEDAEDVDGDKAEDGPQDDYAGGRFAADNAKVRLEDGTVISVSDLKRNNLFQRDYTVKTTELAETRKQIETKASEVDQYAQSLNQERDYILWYAENYMVKEPPQFDGDPSTNPVGYLNHLKAEKAWEQQQQLRSYFFNAKTQQDQQTSAQAEKAARERADQEWSALQKADATFTDRQKATAWYSSAIADASTHYGISEQDIRNAFTTNHGLVLALKDALAYRRLKAKAPEVTTQLQKRPAMVKGGKRAAPGAQDARARQARSERLRQSGSMEDFVSAVQDLL